MNITKNLTFLFSALLSMSTMAASKWSGDWFEVEVILLSQLNDKAQIHEVFPNDISRLPNQASRDLLAAYLQPNIRTLKLQLPLCSSPQYDESLVKQSVTWPTFYPIMSLLEIEQKELVAPLNDSVEASLLQQSGNNIVSAPDNEVQVEDTFNQQPNSSAEESVESVNQPPESNNVLLSENLLTADDSPITAEQLALVEQATLAFDKSRFNYDYLYQKNTKAPHKTIICRITEEEFNQNNADDNLYSYNGFSVSNMPTTINGIENLTSEVPYLISKESLQLRDIYTQLRRSKNFKPLLHLAWRQPVFEQNKSIPTKLYAGDNLQQNYFNELALYQQQQKQLLAHRNVEQGQLVNNELPARNAAEINQGLLEQIKAQRINQILSSVDQIHNPQQVVASLKSSPLADRKLSVVDINSATNISEAELTTVLVQPEQPLQPWYLDGLVDVYLKGVYLHVDAEINMLNHTLTEQASLNLRPSNDITTQIVKLKQSRRLISREVHYFDHPYLGMIVQIRRHKRPEPPEENIDDSSVELN